MRRVNKSAELKPHGQGRGRSPKDARGENLREASSRILHANDRKKEKERKEQNSTRQNKDMTRWYNKMIKLIVPFSKMDWTLFLMKIGIGL